MTRAVSNSVRINWNSQVSACVQERLAELLAAPRTDSPSDMGAIAQQMHALPVYLDMSGALAFTVDGVVLFLDWETEQVTPTTDESWIIVAAVAAAEKYPELRELIPPKPSHATICHSCRGTGKLSLAPKLTVGCWTCRGLGWVETA